MSFEKSNSCACLKLGIQPILSQNVIFSLWLTCFNSWNTGLPQIVMRRSSNACVTNRKIVKQVLLGTRALMCPAKGSWPISKNRYLQAGKVALSLRICLPTAYWIVKHRKRLAPSSALTAGRNFSTLKWKHHISKTKRNSTLSLCPTCNEYSHLWMECMNYMHNYWNQVI